MRTCFVSQQLMWEMDTVGGKSGSPAIISVFLGEQLEDVLRQLISTGEATHSIQGEH